MKCRCGATTHLYSCAKHREVYCGICLCQTCWFSTFLLEVGVVLTVAAAAAAVTWISVRIN